MATAPTQDVRARQTNKLNKIVLNRRAHSSLTFSDTSTFQNDFPGINAILNNNNAYPIDLQAAVDPRFLSMKGVNAEIRQIFRKKKDTIVAIESFWVHAFEYMKNIHNMNNQTWDNYLTKLEATIFQYLLSMGLWHDQMEICLVLIKFWVWKTGNSKKVLRYQSLLFTFASLDWYRVLAPLIRDYLKFSLALRYQTPEFLNGTNFTSVTTMLHTCWLIINAIINCSRFEADYSPFNDHFVFLSLLRQCNVIDNYLDHIVYFLKFGPIKYLKQPARGELEKLLPRNEGVRLFYFELLRLGSHLIDQSIYEFKPLLLEEEDDVEFFGYGYFVHQDSINYMWPTAIEEYETVYMQHVNMSRAMNSDFFK